jgi:hypothetical protein
VLWVFLLYRVDALEVVTLAADASRNGCSCSLISDFRKLFAVLGLNMLYFKLASLETGHNF